MPEANAVKTQDEQLQELRAAVLEMAISLGAALPQTPEVVRTLNALADTWEPS
jgi:hypothetical protein